MHFRIRSPLLLSNSVIALLGLVACRGTGGVEVACTSAPVISYSSFRANRCTNLVNAENFAGAAARGGSISGTSRSNDPHDGGGGNSNGGGSASVSAGGANGGGTSGGAGSGKGAAGGGSSAGTGSDTGGGGTGGATGGGSA